MFVGLSNVVFQFPTYPKHKVDSVLFIRHTSNQLLLPAGAVEIYLRHHQTDPCNEPGKDNTNHTAMLHMVAAAS